MTWENDLSSYQEKSIAATFVCQLQDLEMKFQDARNLLTILAYLDPENIALDMLQTGAAAISELPSRQLLKPPETPTVPPPPPQPLPPHPRQQMH